MSFALSTLRIFAEQQSHTMQTIHIRSANAADVSGIYALVKELATFEKEPNEPSVSLDVFKADFNHFYNCLVAVDGEEIIGIALYYWGYSTWKGKMLYLDDLVVSQKRRGLGIGSALLNRFMAIAKEEHAGIVKWEVLDWNEVAISMYRKAGADISTNWWNCKMDRKAIQEYKPI